MDLFENQKKLELERTAPLARRVRPLTINEFVGQDHIIGAGSPLRKAIETNQIPSLILWGPPGSGKTTLANIISNAGNYHMDSVSAVTSGVAELRNVIDKAKKHHSMMGEKPILFIDEIHRFNKAQQDVMLPHIEDGSVVLIGATTENPAFSITAPLLSRSRTYVLRKLQSQDMRTIILNAINDKDRGLGNLNVVIEDEALDYLSQMCGGDARIALNTLELAANTTSGSETGKEISLSAIKLSLEQAPLKYDRSGDEHFNTISAFIKSVRSSDPDAAIYWLSRMIEGGEDPMFIARRIIILAAEDIGIADPIALSVAVAAQQATHLTGMPECRIPLAEATIYLSTAPKSRSVYDALEKATADVRQSGNLPIPPHLLNQPDPINDFEEDEKASKARPSKGKSQTPGNLPAKLQRRVYYVPSKEGNENDFSNSSYKGEKS